MKAGLAVGQFEELQDDPPAQPMRRVAKAVKSAVGAGHEDMVKRADLDSAVAVLRADTYRALRIQGVGAVGRLKVRARVTLSEQAPSSVPAAPVSGGYPRPASWR